MTRRELHLLLQKRYRTMENALRNEHRPGRPKMGTAPYAIPESAKQQMKHRPYKLVQDDCQDD